jgi:hypothetical protein
VEDKELVEDSSGIEDDVRELVSSELDVSKRELVALVESEALKEIAVSGSSAVRIFVEVEVVCVVDMINTVGLIEELEKFCVVETVEVLRTLEVFAVS